MKKMKKKVIVVYGVGIGTNDYIYRFCKVFKSEKKADRYYDKEYIKLLEMYNSDKITIYDINYEFLDVK